MKHLFAVRNVAAHAEEMGSVPQTAPVFFQKPASCFQSGPELQLPTDIGPIEFEVELAVQVDEPLSRATPEAAGDAIGAVGLALDLTARELQAQRKQAGLPWFEAKGFDGAGVLSELTALDRLEDLAALEPRLEVNGQERQRFTVASYVVPPADLLARCSRWVHLEPGDVVACGTGSGVGRLHQGDHVLAQLGGTEIGIEATVATGPTRP